MLEAQSFLRGVLFIVELMSAVVFPLWVKLVGGLVFWIGGG